MASSFPTTRYAEPITTLSPNDVVLGLGSSKNPGNQYFLKLVRERKETYQFLTRDQKDDMVRELVDRIHNNLHGRFVQEVQNTPYSCRVWYEVRYETALETTKQALLDRENEKTEAQIPAFSQQGSDESQRERLNRETETLVALQASRASAPLSRPSQTSPMIETSVSSKVPAFLTTPLGIPTSFPDLTFLQTEFLANPRFHPQVAQQHDQRFVPGFPVGQPVPPAIVTPTHGPVAINQAAYPPPSPLEDVLILTGALAHQATDIYQRFRDIEWRAASEISPQSVQTTSRKHPLEEIDHPQVKRGISPESKESGCKSVSSLLSSFEGRIEQDEGITDPPNAAGYTKAASSVEDEFDMQDVEPAAQSFLIAALDGDPNRPRLTQEDEDNAWAEMTAEEQAKALEDLFGNMCNIRPSTKRAKRSIHHLLEEMRLEIMSEATKSSALFEALTNCSSKEFSDRRLELFLQTEDMDAKSAARRFILYWEKRRHWFGADKFCLPMTLAGALRDDLAAIQSGIMFLLPGLDRSGRQLLYLVPRHSTFEGYTTENLVRFRWYIAEVASEHPNAEKGIVQLIWQKGSTIWNYDPKIAPMFEIVSLERDVWPVKSVATHVCNTPSFIMQYLRPIVMALFPKDYRARHIFHNVPVEQLPHVLGKYGIPEELVPTEMGGMCRYSYQDWLEGRLRSEGAWQRGLLIKGR